MQIPKFKGREIVPRVKPRHICAGILGENYGKAVDQEVQERYGEFDAISKVGYDSKLKQVVGSTPYYVVAVNEVIGKNGQRTMTYDDFKQIKNSDSLDLRGRYVDIAAVARRLEGYNDNFAKKFLEGKDWDLPVTVNLSVCKLIKDDKSEHGLVILPKDGAQIIPGDVADYKGNAAFSRLCSGRRLGLYSAGGYLAGSLSAGRVVVVEE